MKTKGLIIFFHSELDFDLTLSSRYSKHFTFGPSGVRALPLAFGINVGGHYKWHLFGPHPLAPWGAIFNFRKVLF